MTVDMGSPARNELLRIAKRHQKRGKTHLLSPHPPPLPFLPPWSPIDDALSFTKIKQQQTKQQKGTGATSLTDKTKNKHCTFLFSSALHPLLFYCFTDSTLHSRRTHDPLPVNTFANPAHESKYNPQRTQQTSNIRNNVDDISGNHDKHYKSTAQSCRTNGHDRGTLSVSTRT